MRLYLKEADDIDATKVNILGEVKDSMDKNKYNDGKVRNDLIKVKFLNEEDPLLTLLRSNELIGSGAIRGPFLGTAGTVLLVLAMVTLLLIGFAFAKRKSNSSEKLHTPLDDCTIVTDIENSPEKDNNTITGESSEGSFLGSPYGKQSMQHEGSDLEPINLISVHKCSSATCDICRKDKSPLFVEVYSRRRGRSPTRKETRVNLDEVYGGTIA